MNKLFQSAAIVAICGIASTAGAQVTHIDQNLVRNDGTPQDAAEGDEFGRSVAMENGIVVIGSPLDDDGGDDSGSVYLFDAATNSQTAKLVPSMGHSADDFFGHSVAIHNGVIAVGAYGKGGAFSNQGTLYLFDATTGGQLFLPFVPGFPHFLDPDDEFGRAVAIHNGIVVASVPFDDTRGSNAGAVFLVDASTNFEIAKIFPDDGAADDEFGFSVAIENDVVVIGAPFDDDNGGNSGSVYLFDAITHTQTHKLLPTDGSSSDEFGTSVSISNGIVAVGAYKAGGNFSFYGAVYLFDAATGVQLHKLVPADLPFGHLFGSSVSINNGIVAAGSPYTNDHGSSTGSVYLFDASTGDQIEKILASDGKADAEFGTAVALNNGVLVVGTPLGDVLGSFGTDIGFAYMYNTIDTSCVVDLNNDGVLDFFDISAFLSAFSAGCP